MIRRPPRSTLFPYTTLFRSEARVAARDFLGDDGEGPHLARRVELHAAEFFRNAEGADADAVRSEEHTSELQSLAYLVCRLLLEKKKIHHRSFERLNFFAHSC